MKKIVLAFLCLLLAAPLMATTVQKQFTIHVAPPPLVITTPSPLPDGQVGTPYDVTVQCSGGFGAPFTFSDLDANGNHTLPPSLTINAATGEITGNFDTYGDFSPLINCADKNGNQVTKPLSPSQPPSK